MREQKNLILLYTKNSGMPEEKSKNIGVPVLKESRYE
jgi:hypothetical protein